MKRRRVVEDESQVSERRTMRDVIYEVFADQDERPEAEVKQESDFTPHFAENETPAASSSGAVAVKIVNGQVVLDASSLYLDRTDHSRLSGAQVVDETDGCFVSHLYAKRRRGKRWNQADTERFYDLLRKFGTDFDSIAQCFGQRFSRADVKSKFNREDKFNPDQIDYALSHPLPRPSIEDEVKRDYAQ